jgi:hypothetical protein
MSMDIDVKALKQEWCGWEFDSVDFEIKAEPMTEFAIACGETQPRFIDPDDADFEAVPSYTSRFHGSRAMPEKFPIKSHQSFDAGKSIEVLNPLHAGDTLTAKSEIYDIYEKTGRSGGMVFVVHRMKFSNQRGEPISIVDWRLVQRMGDRKPESEDVSIGPKGTRQGDGAGEKS